MYAATVTESDFMLGGMHVDINACGIKFKKQHKSRVTSMEQHVAVGLPNGVRYQLVPNHPAIYKKVLQIRLASRKSGFGHPTP